MRILRIRSAASYLRPIRNMATAVPDCKISIAEGAYTHWRDGHSCPPPPPHVLAHPLCRRDHKTRSPIVPYVSAPRFCIASVCVGGGARLNPRSSLGYGRRPSSSSSRYTWPGISDRRNANIPRPPQGVGRAPFCNIKSEKGARDTRPKNYNRARPSRRPGGIAKCMNLTSPGHLLPECNIEIHPRAYQISQRRPSGKWMRRNPISWHQNLG